MVRDSSELQPLTPQEIELIDIYRSHKNEDFLIINTVDVLNRVSYAQIDFNEGKILNVEDKDTLEKSRTLRFLKAYISSRDGIPIDQVTQQYLEKKLEKSAKEAADRAASLSALHEDDHSKTSFTVPKPA